MDATTPVLYIITGVNATTPVLYVIKGVNATILVLYVIKGMNAPTPSTVNFLRIYGKKSGEIHKKFSKIWVTILDFPGN